MSMALVVSCWNLKMDKTLRAVLQAMCDSASDESHQTYVSPAYLAYRSDVHLATVYRAQERLAAAGIIEQTGMHGAAILWTIHLERGELKPAWGAPRRGRPRKQENPSHSAKKISHPAKKPSHSAKKISHPAKNPQPARLPQQPVNSGAAPSEPRTYPVMIQSLTSHDPSVARVLSASEPAPTPAGFSLDPQSKTDRDQWASSQQGMHYLLNKAKDWDRLSEASRWWWYLAWIAEEAEYGALVESVLRE